MLHIADPAAGEVEVLVGEREVRFTDPSLVARVAAGHSLREQRMSSHREAPSISKDPVADNTDTYAFVTDHGTRSPHHELPAGRSRPAGGPNFYEFGDDVLYAINVDNDGDGRADIIYQFRFTTEVDEPGHVPLQHRSDRLARQRQLGPAAELHGHQVPDTGQHRPGDRP